MQFCHIFYFFVNVGGGSFFFHSVTSEALGLLKEPEWELSLMMQAAEKSPYQAFSMKQCTPPTSQGNLFVNGFDLSRPLVSDASGRWRLSLFSVLSVHRTACLLPPSSAFISTDSDLYTGTTTDSWSAYGSELHIKPTSCFWFVSCPLSRPLQILLLPSDPQWHVGVEPNKAG